MIYSDLVNTNDLFCIFVFMDFSSKLLELAVNQMSQLPGIGKRTALRLVLHLLKQPKEQTEGIVSALSLFRSEIIFC
jgi:recombination protein RecR